MSRLRRCCEIVIGCQWMRFGVQTLLQFGRRGLKPRLLYGGTYFGENSAALT